MFYTPIPVIKKGLLVYIIIKWLEKNTVSLVQIIQAEHILGQ